MFLPIVSPTDSLQASLTFYMLVDHFSIGFAPDPIFKSQLSTLILSPGSSLPLLDRFGVTTSCYSLANLTTTFDTFSEAELATYLAV